MSIVSTAAAEQEVGLRLKGGMLPCTVLELTSLDVAAQAEALQQRIAEAPAFFANMPFVLSFEHLPEQVADFPIREFLEHCRHSAVHVVAVRQSCPQAEAMARRAGLAVVPVGGTRAQVPEAPMRAEPVSAAPTAARVVRHPVRSGQQICAADGDLIVTAPVSAGAEILAAGNIHVYAPLRGRALAGIRGDETAQIFCQSLEAELVSIAGRYRICEQSEAAGWRQAVQIRLGDDTLHITPQLAARG